MKFFPLKTLILCILLPPILFLFSVEILQKGLLDGYMEERYRRDIENIDIGDTRLLLNGSVRIEDAINRNIRRYLEEKLLLKLGVRANVTVLTRQGTILYPPLLYEVQGNLMTDHMAIASRNLELLNEGLIVKTDLMLNYDSLLSVLVLASYMALALLVFSFSYRSGSRKLQRAEDRKDKELERLLTQEKKHENKLKSLREDRERLTQEAERVKKALEEERAKASKNENEMVEEIISLEERINENIARQEEQKAEIEALLEKLQTLEEEREKRKDTPVAATTSERRESMLQKRFKTLYKNVSFNRRAISGFAELEEDQKIKVEEIIHQLDLDASLVTIKRKVFGKKGRQTVLEVVFGYRGRLYFRKKQDGKIDILTIGTKNTQTKDLEFLNNL